MTSVAAGTWTVDLTAPDTTIDSSPASPSGNTTPTFAFSSNEAGSTFLCKLDKKKFRACSSPKTYKNLKRGKHTFKVEAIDADGNVDKSPAKDKFTIVG